jgi:hypothetical protein
MGEIMKTGIVLRRILCSSLLVFQTAAFSVVEGQQPVVSESRPFVLEDGTPIKLRERNT